MNIVIKQEKKLHLKLNDTFTNVIKYGEKKNDLSVFQM